MKSRDQIENEWYAVFDNDQQLGKKLVAVLEQEGFVQQKLDMVDAQLETKAPFDAVAAIIGEAKLREIFSNSLLIVPPAVLVEEELDFGDFVSKDVPQAPNEENY